MAVVDSFEFEMSYSRDIILLAMDNRFLKNIMNGYLGILYRGECLFTDEH